MRKDVGRWTFQEKKKASVVERGQLIVAVFALCVSFFAVFLSDQQATRSNKTAGDALDCKGSTGDSKDG